MRKVYISVLLLVCGCVVAAAQEEDDLEGLRSPRRKHRRYNRAVNVHETPFDITAPDEDKDKPNLRLKQSALGGGSEDEEIIPRITQPDVPIPPRRERDEESESKNWILPPKPGDLETDESVIPSGWGWLADELRQQQLDTSREEQLEDEPQLQSEEGVDSFLSDDKDEQKKYSTWDLFQPSAGWKPVAESGTDTEQDKDRDRRERGEANRYRNVLDERDEEIDDRNGFGHAENLMEGGGEPAATILSRNTEERDLEDKSFPNMKKALLGFQQEPSQSGTFSAYRAELKRTADSLLGAKDAGSPTDVSSGYAGTAPSRSLGGFSQPSPLSGSPPGIGVSTGPKGPSSGLGTLGSSFDNPGRLQPFQAGGALKPVQPLQDLRPQNALRSTPSLNEQFDAFR